MVGSWQSSFSACLWTETESRSKKAHNRTRPISSYLERIYYMEKRTQFSRGTQRVNIATVLPTRVANHSAGFGSSWLLTELAI